MRTLEEGARTPEQVIADWREHAKVLRMRGHAHDGDMLEKCADEITESMQPLLAWISEPDALLKSGRGVEYFRSRFPEWASQALPLAELRGRQRWYRSIIVPQRAHASIARRAGLRGERAS